MELIEIIKKRIQTQGDISFAEFMQMALYDPQSGYYTTKFNKIGEGGDFVTAPEVSALFGYALANQAQQVLTELEKPVILEFGAGTGKLCVDILTQLEKVNMLPDAYYILEVSGELQARQKKLINEKIPHISQKVIWLQELPTEPLQGVVFANEVLDAMPVNRFFIQDKELYEGYVTVTDNQLTEKIVPNTNQELAKYVDEFLQEDYKAYQSEANLFAEHWVKSLANTLSKGAVFILDYGFPAHEYYHPDRSNGTLMCHYQQKAHTNPFINVGDQDITAHVNFTHIAEAGYNNGFNISGFTNQATFLLNNAILDFLQNAEEKAVVKHNQALKTLLQPSEMGELFKVIALTKEIDLDINGFKFNDKRVSL